MKPVTCVGFLLFSFPKLILLIIWGVENDGRWTKDVAVTKFSSRHLLNSYGTDTGICFQAFPWRVWIRSEDLLGRSKLSFLSYLWASARCTLLNRILSWNCWFSILCAHWKGSLNCLWVKKKQKQKTKMCSSPFVDDASSKRTDAHNRHIVLFVAIIVLINWRYALFCKLFSKLGLN